MSEKFTARRGGVVTVNDDGTLTYDCYVGDGCEAHHLDLGHGAVRALREYFAQEDDHKRWHSAEPGELWSVKVEGWDVERCFVFAPVEGPYRFQTETETHIPVTDERIVSAVRIYPEEES